MELVECVHRTEAEVGGRPLCLILVRGERNVLLEAGDARSGALSSGDYVQGSVYLGLDGTRRLCPTYTDLDPYLETIDLFERPAPSELHGSHWRATGGDAAAALLEESRADVEHLDGVAPACLAAAPEGLALRAPIERVKERLDEPWDSVLATELVYSLDGHAERMVASGTARGGRGSDGRVVSRLEGAG